MNILVIGHYGIYEHLSASFVHSQAKAYVAQGHQVRVIIPVPVGKTFQGSKLGPAFHVRQADGMTLYYVRYLSASNFGQRHINTACAICALRPHLRTILHGFAPDVIHAHTLSLDSGIGRWLKKRLGCPLVVTTHGSDTFVPYTAGKFADLRAYAQGADTVVCVSTLLRRRLEEAGISQPMEVILNGFRVTQTPPQEKPPLSLVQAGYLVPRKKADVTIRAFAKLRETHSEATLTIVGNGPEEQRFHALAQQLQLGDSIRFTGYLPNEQLLAEVAKARFFVMPSVREGFGIVYLEAMANGCVTIGTQGEGIADLITSGTNGYLVPADDPDAIVAVIEACLRDPQAADAVAEQGRSDAVGLTWEKNALQYLTLFQRLRNSH